jgi:hypothetical protein
MVPSRRITIVIDRAKAFRRSACHQRSCNPALIGGVAFLKANF